MASASPDGTFKLALRRLTPEPIKRGLRLARLATSPAPPAAPTLPAEVLVDCALLPSRLAMLDRIPKGGVVVELGTLKGDFSREILARCRPAHLHLVDVDFSALAPAIRSARNVTLHEGLTTDMLARFPDESLDFIYVDADHSYAAVKADIAAALGKLKRGGIIGFNDFARIVRPGFGVFGVHQAVCEFAATQLWPMVYFCLDGEALYDVAFRKPGGA